MVRKSIVRRRGPTARQITPRWDAAMLAEITRATGIEATPIHPLPADLGAALEQVRGWKGREGVVGRFVDAAGAPRLIKIKAADYLRLHAYRSILGGAGALKIAWLLDIHEPCHVMGELTASPVMGGTGMVPEQPPPPVVPVADPPAQHTMSGVARPPTPTPLEVTRIPGKPVLPR